MRPLVETTALVIRDPVRRLRYLRSVAPKSDLGLDGRPQPRRAVRLALLGLLIAVALVPPPRTRATPPPPVPPPAPEPLPDRPAWLVEQTAASEVYSNGLRIDTTAITVNRRRPAPPVGLVFHSTESELAPFEPGQNDALKKIGESLLDYVRRRRSYHYLIDRFGRVYRVVGESDTANHAGHSVWADGETRYVNLNDSFLGVAFEGRGTSMTQAQVHSGAMLVEVLRVRYRIAARNCVTHAQVSVNPANRRVGYHVDWASGFPFAELGLPDNYAIPLPAIWAFGYRADAAYLAVAGPSLRAAVYSAVAGMSGRKKNTMPTMM
jgi:hypothetical protein